MINEADIELIEKYLEGKLIGDALILFEKRMENDFQFKKEVELQRLTILAIQREGRSDLREKIKLIAKDIEPISITWYSHLPFIIVAAASVILILSLGIYFTLQNNKEESRLVKNKNSNKNDSIGFYG